MLKGKSILLRPVHQSDLQELYARHIDISNRGNFYPLGFVSESEFRRRFEDKGFWEKEEGMLLVVDGAVSGSSSTPKIAPRVGWPKNAALFTKALPVAPGITWEKITTLKYTPSSGTR
jgi:hypothetical protein